MDTASNDDMFKDILPAVMQVIRASSGLAAQDVKFYKSIDSELSLEIDNSANGLINLANRLLAAAGDLSEESPKLELAAEGSVSESEWKPISNVLDSLFEKIDIAFDAARRGALTASNTSGHHPELIHLEDGSNGADVKLLSKRLAKPQALFANKIDNSEQSPFKPKLTSKPHSIVPFEEAVTLKYPEAVYEDDIEVVDPPYYPHPYESEVDKQPYPDAILEKSEPIESKDWKDTTATWIDTPELLTSMILKLSSATEIAVDLEHHDNRTYYGLVCLMQISDRNEDWIVDTLALRDQLEPLNAIFANPQIVKVFHGAFMDIIWLQRDLGLYVVSLFDTFHAAKALGFPKLSLAYLLESIAHFKTSKKYQLADWRIRPLPPAMMSYARSDTHFLLNIFDQLKNKLIDALGEKLQQVLHESRKVAKRRFEYTRFRPLSSSPGSRNVSCPIMSSNPREPYMSLMLQYNVPRPRKAIVEALYNWRDSVARLEDESPRFIMPNQLLVSIACLNKPVDTKKILNSANFVSDHVRLHAKQISEIVESALELLDDVPELMYPEEFGSNEIESWTSEKVAWAAQEFKHLLEKQANLVPHTADTTSSLGPMGIFRQLFEATQDTVEYDAERMEAVKHDFAEELGTRFRHAVEGLERQESEMIDKEAEQEESEAEIIEVKHDATESEPTESIAKAERLDPNEVITIRKRQEQSQKRNTLAQDDETVNETPLNYASADKILLGGNSRDRQRPKKRAFDPYSKESEGPQGVKKARRINAGKTSTFSTRRRNK